MRTSPSSPLKARIVGDFIRKRREAIGLSQRALGQGFSPPVTTQFISNIERGVTPLPPAHIPTLARILAVAETELAFLMEKEYATRLSSRVPGGHDAALQSSEGDHRIPLWIRPQDLGWLEKLVRGLEALDEGRKEAFRAFCSSFFNSPFEASAGKRPRTDEPR